MIVMPADNTGNLQLAERFTGRVGMLYGIGGWKNPRGLPFALDNGRFSVWAKGKEWSEDNFLRTIDRAKTVGYSPLWLAVPDSVGDAAETESLWLHCVSRFQQWDNRNGLGWPLALCVQDGMTPRSVRALPWQPDVIFVGGTDRWKWSTAWNWCREFPRVHIGRVNGNKWLWNAHRCGAESCDGTGWYRGDRRQYRGLIRYLEMAAAGLDPPQLELGYARHFGGRVPERSFVT